MSDCELTLDQNTKINLKYSVCRTVEGRSFLAFRLYWIFKIIIGKNKKCIFLRTVAAI